MDGWCLRMDGWSRRRPQTPPCLSLGRGTELEQYITLLPLPLALCHLHFAILHFAIFTLPFCCPKSDPESASDSTRVRGFLTKWFKMDPEMDPTMCSSEPEIWQSARMAESASSKVPKWQTAQTVESPSGQVS